MLRASADFSFYLNATNCLNKNCIISFCATERVQDQHPISEIVFVQFVTVSKTKFRFFLAISIEMNCSSEKMSFFSIRFHTMLKFNTFVYPQLTFQVRPTSFQVRIQLAIVLYFFSCSFRLNPCNAAMFKLSRKHDIHPLSSNFIVKIICDLMQF